MSRNRAYEISNKKTLYELHTDNALPACSKGVNYMQARRCL
ncbi:hypothetical protein [Bacteroides nordii]|nr:hypothetical protein [Bacteroides nordii]